MAQAYTPGLKVAARVRHRCRRLLPVNGTVRVRPGDRVQATDVVAESFLPGDVVPLNLAHLLSLPPADAAACVLKKEGERIEAGQVLARTKGFFGLFQSEYRAKVTGTIETISRLTGQVIIRGTPQPIELPAYLAGEVVEVLPDQGAVIEAEVTFIQGIFGIGGEAFGPIRMACPAADQDLTADRMTAAMKGAVVVGGRRVTEAALDRAVQTGVAAIVTGGIDDDDLRKLLGYDLGVAITGSENVGLTLVITEGFGDIAMAERTWRMLQGHDGREAAVNGATQIRAGVQRPEVVVPLSTATDGPPSEREEAGGRLDIGSPVRMIREPHFGLLGTVAALPPERRQLPSESKARVVEVQLQEGERVFVPRANVERIVG